MNIQQNGSDLTHPSFQSNVGTIVSIWVMSGDDDQFQSKWFSVFGPGPQKLLFTWHVHRAWRGLPNGIKDRELAQKFTITYAGGKNEKRFEFTKWDTKPTVKFTETRDFLIILYHIMLTENICVHFTNTNMYVEAFHRVHLHGNRQEGGQMCTYPDDVWAW